uniref:EndoU domain-containing protein n=1 Tax=Erythrolobus australicus TaxID=1077150 RepID=A0A7S1XJG0_9RHOD|mmetsp:Transcript_741/g.1963  ORF Transcript_741/g.1963 Transcript_741/m.1963 type:complete len:393 (+) Transcript_741:82-1260(+)
MFAEHELRVAAQKRLAFIRAMQFQHKAPNEEQLGSFLQAVRAELRGLAQGAENADELAGAIDALLEEHLREGIAFDETDDALEALLRELRVLEVNAAVAAVEPDDDALASLPLALAELWKLDINRLEPNIDYVLDLQSGKKFHERSDSAERPLFKYIARSVFQRPTYQLFYALLDNYEFATGVEETETQQEKSENRAFIDAIYSMPVMRYVHKYAASRGWLESEDIDDPDDVGSFKRLLYRLWFHFYRREGRNDSSGFEHVFLGEVRDGKVIGLHNWIQLLREERSGKLNYTGYILPRRRSTELPEGDEHILGIQFEWNGAVKPMSSIFVGVSPEFELALYTLAFLNAAHGNEGDDGVVCATLEDEVDVRIVAHLMGRHRPRLGSCYPEIVE